MHATEHAAATAAIRALIQVGFAIDEANDGWDSQSGPMSASAAVDFISGVDGEVYVSLTHPAHGRVTLAFLFQCGAPEEVLFNYSASTPETLALVERMLDAA